MHPQTHKPTERLGMSSTDTPFAKDAARRAAQGGPTFNRDTLGLAVQIGQRMGIDDVTVTVMPERDLKITARAKGEAATMRIYAKPHETDAQIVAFAAFQLSRRMAKADAAA